MNSKTKKIIIPSGILIIAMFVAFVIVTNARTVVQGPNNPYGGTFAIDAIAHQPALYMGHITLVGTVGTSQTQDFAVATDNGQFYVLVDYRGGNALPAEGSHIAVTGVLRPNRPCCGPGYTVRSTSFEVGK